MDRAEKRTTETDGKRLSFLFLCCISLPSFPDRTISTAAARKHLHSITINSPLTFVSWKTTERRLKATTAGCTLILMQRLPSEGTPTWKRRRSCWTANQAEQQSTEIYRKDSHKQFEKQQRNLFVSLRPAEPNQKIRRDSERSCRALTSERG